jgi:hypothetical protein
MLSRFPTYGIRVCQDGQLLTHVELTGTRMIELSNQKVCVASALLTYLPNGQVVRCKVVLGERCTLSAQDRACNWNPDLEEWSVAAWGGLLSASFKFTFLFLKFCFVKNTIHLPLPFLSCFQLQFQGHWW